MAKDGWIYGSRASQVNQEHPTISISLQCVSASPQLHSGIRKPDKHSFKSHSSSPRPGFAQLPHPSLDFDPQKANNDNAEVSFLDFWAVKWKGSFLEFCFNLSTSGFYSSATIMFRPGCSSVLLLGRCFKAKCYPADG